jgi:ribosome-associated protein
VNTLDKALAAAQAALEKKAYDVVVLEVEHLRSIADYFLIATGRSDVQVRSIAQGVEERLAREEVRLSSIEGFELGHWVVLDIGDVVAHIFFEPTRQFYRLENNWLDACEVELPEPIRSMARGQSLHRRAGDAVPAR